MILKGSASSVTSATDLSRATRIRVAATNAGTVTVAATLGTFNAQSAVAAAAITVTSHGFITGDQVTYAGADAIAELTDGADYYVIKVDANTVNLTTTHHDAADGINALTLTDGGTSENHTITAVNTYAGTVVLIQNDVILIDKKPGDTIAAGAAMSMTSIGNQP